ncbi:NAD(P)H-dependent oxidoreductase [Companilactobacillus allii]|uniref:Flavodoxin n=1 Tax=Companilactobacillus allii TaxID=1847728 RepID=A0A1P8Q0P4_9LACO|nr:NAD(P)H-dependent oxidoreductase [Companilactobacillus allii]APX71444.1 flavodoxin [Companilactobacillus allii]USQ68525.1 NAD(P)H-dependent oxidoreductase [Companilactobacillus allii]
MKTIIYSHLYDGSFNHAILDRLTKTFDNQKADYQIINLYKDGFNPVLSSEELRNYSKGESFDPLVKKYQKMISDSDELIFIFPIWWHNLPAILKGFIDKTMVKGFAYNEDNGWTGLLTYIKKTTVITTSTITKEYLKTESGDPIQGVFINRTLADIGLKPENTNWIHFGEVNITSDEVRTKFLKDLPDIYKN